MFKVCKYLCSGFNWKTVIRKTSGSLSGGRNFYYRERSTSTKGEEYIIGSKFPELHIPDIPISELLWSGLGAWAHKVAIECAETRKHYTYSDLLKHVKRFATWLTKLELGKRDVICIALPNAPEFAVAALGSIHVGCTVSPVNPLYTEYELSHMFSITRPKVVVTNNECYKTVKIVLNKIEHQAKIVVVEKNGESVPSDAIRFSEVGENDHFEENILQKLIHAKDDVLFLPFSSGTTGLPKAVQISHKNVVSAVHTLNYEEIRQPEPAIGSHQDVVPCVLPFFHIFGLVALMLTLNNGCKLITMSKFNPALYLDVLLRDRASLLYVVPPLANFLGKTPAVTAQHLASSRHLVCGGASLSPRDAEILTQKFPVTDVILGYATTESTSLGTLSPKGSNKDYSGVGFLSSNLELRIVDTVTGNVLPPDQEGELEMRGPTITPGYYKNKEANRVSFSCDGFYRTGDLASYSQAAGLRIKDRLKELIKVKGMQVAPAELEQILASHAAVSEVAVAAAPHRDLGEVPYAFVVLNDHTDRPEQQQLIRFAADKLADYKRIHKLVYLKELPKSGTGKVLRRKLKEYM